MATACNDITQLGWLALRQELWPHCTTEEHLADMTAFLAEPQRFAQFVEYDGSGSPVGLIEVSVRSDYVNGADTLPIAFLEGIYVVPAARRSGIARRLLAEAERWALEVGCTELASDARLENTSSHAMHVALGFVETERVLFFKKELE